MADRRMFSKTIIDSDAFLDMPLSTQALYFHLSMRGDDDGFINNPKKIQRMLGCTDDDVKLLIAKCFIIPFDSGVVVIKHWRIHNYIRTDRYKETIYQQEKQQLVMKDNKEYKKLNAIGIPADNQTVYQLETQVRLGKDSIDKDNIYIQDSTKKLIRHKYGEYKNVLLSDADMEKLKAEFPFDWEERIENLSEYMASSGRTYKNFLATIRKWAKTEKPACKNKKKDSYTPPDDGLAELLGGK